MKSINYCAIIGVAFAACFTGSPTTGNAQQAGHSCAGGCDHGQPDDEIELIPYGPQSQSDRGGQLSYRMQGPPESYGNERSFNRMPYSNAQQDFAYRSNSYQAEPYPLNRLPRAQHERTRYRDVPNPGNLSGDPGLRPLRSDRDHRHNSYRQDFGNQEPQYSRSHDHRHHGKCHGRCGSRTRENQNDDPRRRREYEQRDPAQFNERLPNQFRNDADQPPRLDYRAAQPFETLPTRPQSDAGVTSDESTFFQASPSSVDANQPRRHSEYDHSHN